MIKMDKLRESVEGLGFENVKSYINSGNIIFETGKADDKNLADKIHDLILEDFGFDISVMVRSMVEIEQIIAKNPFDGQFENDKLLHVFFLKEKLTAEQEALLFAQASDNEQFAVIDRHMLCLLKISILDSAVGKGFIDKKLRVATTARNWRTVKKISEL